MKGKIGPVQIRLPVELVKHYWRVSPGKKEPGSADFAIQKTIPTIERNSLVHTINEICSEVLDQNRKANGILQRQVRSIVKEMLAES
jgi:hypothetical protein